ncbi:MAG: SRPBCC domain-containing protein [Arenicellales bacterium]
MNELSVNIQHTLHAPIETVFDAWLNPELLSQFILPMSGMAHPKVEIEAKQGGKFTIIMQVGDQKIPHTGEYIEVDRPNKLVFTWVSPATSDDSTVTLNFKAMSSNTTEIHLSHVTFPDEQSRSSHEGGWSNILSSLAKLISE